MSSKVFGTGRQGALLTCSRPRYLLDTNVLSEPVRQRPDAAVLHHLDAHGAQSCTAAMVMHELHYGAARLDEGRRKHTLLRYLDNTVSRLEVLAYDRAAALWHASERAKLEREGRTASFTDGQIASIAAVNDLAVVTANIAQFEPFAVEVIIWHTR